MNIYFTILQGKIYIKIIYAILLCLPVGNYCHSEPIIWFKSGTNILICQGKNTQAMCNPEFSNDDIKADLMSYYYTVNLVYPLKQEYDIWIWKLEDIVDFGSINHQYFRVYAWNFGFTDFKIQSSKTSQKMYGGSSGDFRLYGEVLRQDPEWISLSFDGIVGLVSLKHPQVIKLKKLKILN